MTNPKETIKITFLAKPEVPQKIVEQKAKDLKYAELYEKKLAAYHAKSKKSGGVKKGKKKLKANKEGKPSTKSDSNKHITKGAEKGRSKKKAASIRDAPPTIVINDDEIRVDYLDLYPAEMVYWRGLEPYYIKSQFACQIDYDCSKVYRRKDTIYLDVLCKVVRPDFSVDLNEQRIDFGPCLIGTRVTKTVTLQNITCKYFTESAILSLVVTLLVDQDIWPKVSLLNPVGSFSIPHIRHPVVPPEHFLNLPITFTPTSEDKAIEYFEIVTSSGAVPLVLCGEGREAVLKVTPPFEVFRLDTKRSKVAELQLKIENASEVEALVEFRRLFEIEADSAPPPPKADKKKPKDARKPKNSDNLTEEELAAIGKLFEKTSSEESSHFQFKNVGEEKNGLRLQPKQNHNLTIYCGDPVAILKKISKESRRKKKKGDGSGKSTPEQSEKSSATTSETGQSGGKRYATQFNIGVGTKVLKSVVILCTIKT